MAAYAIQFRRGTTTEHSSFTGLLGEVTVDTTKKTIVVHDGSTAGGSPLALEGAAVSSTTGSFSSNVTVGGTLGVTGLATMSGAAAVTGDLTMTGHVLPSANITYDLGSTTKMWRDVYVGPGSLYINGKKVIEDDSGTISITTDTNEDLKFTTSGTGTLKLISGNGINITGELGAVSGDLQIGDHMDMNSNLIKELATPVSSTDAANKAYVDSAAASAITGGTNAISGTTGAFSSNLTVDGNLTVSGTTTTVNTTDVLFEDNMFVLNSNTTGTPSENSGFEVERGDSLNVQFLWNETDDRWSTGSNTLHAGALVANTFTGDVTGNVTGNIDGVVGGNTPAAGSFTSVGGTTITASNSFQGDLVGDVTGNTSGSAGTVTSIAAHVLDEDDLATDSATQVPSQQSVKAYVAAQVATKDNTDEMTEGSTNLYFTNARARGAISVSGDISYNSSTGVISTTGLASSDTDDLAEGSSNLYYTDARVDAYVNASILTTDISEGTNLYYTDARADARAQLKIDGIVASAPGTLDTLNELAAALGDDASFSTTVTNSIATKLASADFNSTFDTRIGTKSTSDLSEGTNLYYTDARADARITASDTDALSEGSSNLYYTDARADARAQLKIDGIVASAPGTLDTLNELAAALGDDASFSTTVTNSIATKLATGDFNSTFDTRIGTKSTSDLSEGTNLYFTDARADARIAAASTTDLSEGGNLYFTDARADARIANATTSDLSEGTNEYHTTARARAAISGAGSLSYNSTTGVMSYTQRTDEELQDLVGAMLSSNTETGITVSYQDGDGSIDLVVNTTHFHSSVQTVTSSEETTNVSSTVAYTFSELTNAQHYAVFLNRQLLRPTEYTVSGTSVTVSTGVIAEGDEIEVTGFTNT